MRYGVVLPGGTAPEQLDQAVLAEQLATMQQIVRVARQRTATAFGT